MPKCTNCESQTSFGNEQTRGLDEDERAKAGYCASCWKRRNWKYRTPDEIEAIRKMALESRKERAERNAAQMDKLRSGEYTYAKWRCIRCGGGATSTIAGSCKAVTEVMEQRVIERARLSLCSHCYVLYQKFLNGDAIEAIRQPSPGWHCPECRAKNRHQDRHCTACGASR